MIDTTIKSTLLFRVSRIWQYRELLLNLIRRDIKTQVKQSLLGYAWIFIPPLMQMGIFTLLFQVILQLPMTESVPYPVFLYCTQLPWRMFSGMVGQGTGSLVSYGGLLKKVYFPKEVAVLSGMSAQVVKTLIASAALVVLMVHYKIGVGLNLLWLPLLIVVQLLFTFGLILPLAVLNAFTRDVSKGISIVLTLWMYATPVVYPIEQVPEAYRNLYFLNPMAVLIQGYRNVLLENSPPGEGLVIVALMAIAICLLGMYVFSRFERSIIDVI